jgi:hypothetical protein
VKKGDGTRAESPSGKGAKLITKDVAVFAFFLFLSFIFWYINSLGKDMEAGIHYPVKYTNIPRDKSLNAGQSTELNLFIKGPGFSILKLRLSGKKNPLLIDISKVNYKRLPGDKAFSYYIITSSLSKSLQVQMRSGCEITSVKPDTLFFSLVRISSNHTDSPEVKKKK